VTAKKQNRSPKDYPLLGNDIEAYSIAETSRLFGLSIQRIRRLLSASELDGIGHRPTSTGLGYVIPISSMVAKGYKLKEVADLGSVELLADLKDEKATLEKRLKEMAEQIITIKAQAEAKEAENKVLVERADMARSSLESLRQTLDGLERVAEAKTREAFLLEQALLRIPLSLGTGKSWWQKLKKATQSDSSSTTP